MTPTGSPTHTTVGGPDPITLGGLDNTQQSLSDQVSSAKRLVPYYYTGLVLPCNGTLHVPKNAVFFLVYTCTCMSMSMYMY